jgi:uncharacterized surface protein with fasciclin (FAS1) repeats
LTFLILVDVFSQRKFRSHPFIQRILALQKIMHFYNSVKALNKFTGIAAALLILPIAVACGSQTGDTTAEVPQATEAVPAPVPAATPEATTPTTEGGTIVDVAISNGSFDTLVAAIQAADLATTLSGTGPFTVFAPTDEAFAALPQGTLEKLLLPKNKEALAKILTYHVVSGEVLSSDIKAGAVATVEGEDVDIAVAAGKVTVNAATVTQPDVTASNGVIHVIDTVLLPPDVDLTAL